MPNQISPKIIALIFSILVICFATAFYIIAWQEPSQTAPEGNVAAPINVGTIPQAKAGRISATEFYDYNDSNYYLNPNGGSKLKEGIKIDEGATYFDALEICNFGTCCSPWKDCDGDLHTYLGSYMQGFGYVFNFGAGQDCDEGCNICYKDSSEFTETPDSKDQDCDGTIDEGSSVTQKKCNLGTTEQYNITDSCRNYCSAQGKDFGKVVCTNGFRSEPDPVIFASNCNFATCGCSSSGSTGGSPVCYGEVVCFCGGYH